MYTGGDKLARTNRDRAPSPTPFVVVRPHRRTQAFIAFFPSCLCGANEMEEVEAFLFIDDDPPPLDSTTPRLPEPRRAQIEMKRMRFIFLLKRKK